MSRSREPSSLSRHFVSRLVLRRRSKLFYVAVVVVGVIVSVVALVVVVQMFKIVLRTLWVVELVSTQIKRRIVCSDMYVVQDP